MSDPTQSRSPQPVRGSTGPRERVVLGAVFALLSCLAWIGGCAFTPVELALGWAGLAVLLIAMFLPFDRADPADPAGPNRRHPALAMLRDPIFVLGGLFLLLLLTQALNSDRSLTVNPATMEWEYGPPPAPRLPSSINGSDAFRVLHWFVPAFACMLAVRKRLQSRHSRRMLLDLMSVNAGAIAIFGIVQMLLGRKLGYGLQDLQDEYYFAGFGYPNHAGAYFCLLFAVASSSLCVRLLDSRSRGGAWTWALACSALLCMAAVVLSFSRAAVLLCGGLALLIGATIIVHGWGAWGPATRLNVIVGVAGIASAIVFLVAGLSQTLNGKAFEDFSIKKGELQTQFGGVGRCPVGPILRMCRNAPWFGAGGWGYRYLIPLYAERDPGDDLGTGTANVHCDPVQFMVEFGAVGTALMLGCVGIAVASALRAGRWRHPDVFIVLAGLAATFVHSLIDLPFRSPAILCAWTAVLAGLSRSTPARTRVIVTGRQEGAG